MERFRWIILFAFFEAFSCSTVNHTYCDHLILTNIRSHAESKYYEPQIPTYIDAKVVLISLNDMDDASEVMSITARVDLTWHDSRFAISSIPCQDDRIWLPMAEIWHPKIIFRNGAEQVLYPEAWNDVNVDLVFVKT